MAKLGDDVVRGALSDPGRCQKLVCLNSGAVTNLAHSVQTLASRNLTELSQMFSHFSVYLLRRIILVLTVVDEMCSFLHAAQRQTSGF